MKEVGLPNLGVMGDTFHMKKGERKEFFDQYTQQAIRNIKELEKQLS